MSKKAPKPSPLNLADLPELMADGQVVAGVDEVGRGALFGEVVAAAVILPRSAIAPLINLGVRDSKQLSPQQRQRLAVEIKTWALAWQIAAATVEEIDRLNILQASLLAMKRAVTNLTITPQLCLVDGNQTIPGLSIPQQTIIGGDGRSLVIAAASILAKVERDRLILKLAAIYPEYDLEHNKGYGTKKHRIALHHHGASPLHRHSFRLGI